MAETVLWAADELRLAIGRQTIYDGAEFYINAGERVALVGRNGSGKSTLLRLITGDEIPSSGNITRARNLRVAVLPQDFEVDDGRTIRENVADGLAYFRELQEKFETVSRELQLSGCDSLILGCTELSLIKKNTPLGHGYLDALEVLAKRCVQACGAPLKTEYSVLFT